MDQAAEICGEARGGLAVQESGDVLVGAQDAGRAVLGDGSTRRPGDGVGLLGLSTVQTMLHADIAGTVSLRAVATCRRYSRSSSYRRGSGGTLRHPTRRSRCPCTRAPAGPWSTSRSTTRRARARGALCESPSGAALPVDGVGTYAIDHLDIRSSADTAPGSQPESHRCSRRVSLLYRWRMPSSSMSS